MTIPDNIKQKILDGFTTKSDKKTIKKIYSGNFDFSQISDNFNKDNTVIDEVIDYFKDNPDNVNDKIEEKNNKYTRLLHEICKHHNGEYGLKKLFNIKNLDLDATDSEGNTAILKNSMRVKIVKLLIEHNAKLNIKNNKGQSMSEWLLGAPKSHSDLLDLITEKNFTNGKQGFREFKNALNGMEINSNLLSAKVDEKTNIKKIN